MHHFHVLQPALHGYETDRLLACSQLLLFYMMRHVAFRRFCDHQIVRNVIVFANRNSTQFRGLFFCQYSILNGIYS